MPTALFRIRIAGLFVVLATALPGCGRPEGLGSIDADAARQALIAQGGPDPLARAGQARYQVPPKAPNRPALSRHR